jgi:hypothetical protein
MLAELAVWLLTPVPWRFRRLGMLGDSVRLWSRGRRRAAQWASHEQNCHAIVRQAVAGLARHDTVVVLGSGLARDVPLAELCARFRRVVLVDAVHLLPLRLSVLRYRNVTLLTRDLTGMIDWIGDAAQGRQKPLADLAGDSTVDLVISANILSQLGFPVEGWLERRPGAAGKLPHDPAGRVIDWHLDDLSHFNCPVCLLTDTGYRELDMQGKSVAEHDLLYGRSLPEPDASWDWPVAPRGEFSDGTTHIHWACGFTRFSKAKKREMPGTWPGTRNAKHAGPMPIRT